MRKIMDIGFDLDDVVFKTAPISIKGLKKYYGVDLSNQNSERFIIDGVTDEELFNKINDIIRENESTIELNEGILDTLKYIYKINKEPLIFITARPSYLKTTTEVSLRRFLGNIPFKIFFTSRSPKMFYILVNNITYFVDDYVKTMNELAPILKIGFLYNTARNKNGVVLHQNIKRIDSITEIFNHT